MDGARERLNLVIVGHVDHGKSTVIGRLLADTHSLPDGKLEQVRALCDRTGRPFEFAFLLDALQDERAQGITIDSARVFFKTPKRDYLIIDAPGHIEFLKNMITGAARADAALLVIDAQAGVQENSRRHGYLLSLLGIRQVVVLVNKMDLVGFDADRFGQIEAEYRAFLARIDVRPAGFIPVGGRDGHNIATRSPVMEWYAGPTVLEALDRFSASLPAVDGPFRMPVQGVYKFTGREDDRRIVAGSVVSGRARVGDEVVFYPSGKKAHVRSFEAFAREAPAAAEAGEAAGLTLREQIYVTRGEVATLAREARPAVSSRVRVSLFWLGRDPLVPGRSYTMKIGTARVPVRVESITRVIDAAELASSERRSHVDRHEVAECVLETGRAVAVDLAGIVAETSRFVLVDGYEISGGGLIREALPDTQADAREKVMLRNAKWEPSLIAPDRRATRFAQRATLILVTGPEDADRKSLARALESRLFEEGRLVYFLGIGNVLYGVDSDIDRNRENRHEHIRRLAEVANLMLDSGMILIVTASELTGEDLDVFRTTVDAERIESVWIGDTRATDFPYDLHVSGEDGDARATDAIRRRLEDRGILFRPW